MQTFRFQDTEEPADEPAPAEAEPVDAADAEVADDEGGDEMMEEEDSGVSRDGILAYGIVAEVLTILPLVLILIGAGDSKISSYHQKYMENTVGAWAPFAILFWIQFVEDNKWVRLAMMGALASANAGGWSGMWAGWYEFLMQCHAADAFGTGTNTLFAILYPVINVGLIIMQWYAGKDVMNWIENAPYCDIGGGCDEEMEGDDDMEGEDDMGEDDMGEEELRYDGW